MSDFDDLSVGLARASSKPWFSKTSLILGGLVLLVAGFLVGLKAAPKSSTPATGAGFDRNALASQFGQFRNGGTGNGGFSGGGSTGSARNATTGKIKLVDGKTVYVELTDGTIVTVKVADTTKIASSATVKDLKAGASVTVQGETGEDGTITAGSITQTK